MRRPVLLALCVASACTPASSPDEAERVFPLSFRALTEGQNPAFCVPGPEFAVALDEDAWIDVFDRQTECRPDVDVELPDVNFRTEFAIAAWWKVAACLGATVRTRTVQVRRAARAEVVVFAESREPSPGRPCAAVRAGLESFLAVKRSPLLNGKEPLAFVLDTKLVARIEPEKQKEP